MASCRGYDAFRLAVLYRDGRYTMVYLCSADGVSYGRVEDQGDNETVQTLRVSFSVRQSKRVQLTMTSLSSQLRSRQ
jgi:hypothetical protein